MSKVKSDNAAFFMAGFGDRLHIERLAGVIVHSAEENQRDRISFALDRFKNVFGSKCGFAVTRC